LVEIRDDPMVDVVAEALPHLFGYLLSRCGSRALAEDLTSESVVAAIDRVRAGDLTELTTAYLVGIARHKLIDHWRRAERELRHMRMHSRPVEPTREQTFEPGATDQAMLLIAPMQRAALTLRYVDDLPVPEVAAALSLSMAATEKLLSRAKRAFRHHYTRARSDEHD
jgi:RNA polymerase sigma-70 factor (ECF subfamily)